jgi:O-antigen/teichoic acid export membrane protein
LIKQNSFIHDTLVLSGGTAAAQGIAFLIAPVLTRLYMPSHFGLFAIFSSVIAILSPLASGRYAMAIMLPKEEHDAFWLVQLTALISAVFCFTLFLFMPQIYKGINIFRPDINTGSWVLLIPPAIFIGSLYQGFTLWGNRRNQFKSVGFSKIIQVALMVVVQLIAALLGFGAMGLIAGHITGYFVGSLSLALLTLDRKIISIGFASFETFKRLALRYINFPRYMSLGGLMDAMSVHITPIMLALYFAESEVGFYALTYTVITVPVSLIGRSMSNVFFERAAKKRSNKQDISYIVEKIIPVMFLVSSLITVIFVFGGPALFGFIFGDKWIEAGRFVQILAPMFFLQFLISPITPILVVLEQQRLLGLIQGLLLTVTIISLICGGELFNDIHKTLILFSLSRTLIYAIYLVTIWKSAGASLQNVINNISIFLSSGSTSA